MKTTIFFILILLTGSLSSQNKIEVTTKRNSDRSVTFSYKKSVPGSYLLKIEFSGLRNANDPRYERVVKYPSGVLFTLKPIDDNGGVGFSYRSSYKRGDVFAKPTARFNYMLPFPPETEIRIQEAKNVRSEYFKDETPEGWKAYAFFSKTQDSVVATRKGIIVDIKDSFDPENIDDYAYSSKYNGLLIEHEDGTYSSYKGFVKGSFDIELGETVYPGTYLGKVMKRNERAYVLNYFTFYYSKSKKSDDQKIQTKFVVPHFSTTGGNIQLINGESYLSLFNDELFKAEMTKKEIKRLAKSGK